VVATRLFLDVFQLQRSIEEKNLTLTLTRRNPKENSETTSKKINKTTEKDTTPPVDVAPQNRKGNEKRTTNEKKTSDGGMLSIQLLGKISDGRWVEKKSTAVQVSYGFRCSVYCEDVIHSSKSDELCRRAHREDDQTKKPDSERGPIQSRATTQFVYPFLYLFSIT